MEVHTRNALGAVVLVCLASSSPARGAPAAFHVSGGLQLTAAPETELQALGLTARIAVDFLDEQLSLALQGGYSWPQYADQSRRESSWLMRTGHASPSTSTRTTTSWGPIIGYPRARPSLRKHAPLTMAWKVSPQMGLLRRWSDSAIAAASSSVDVIHESASRYAMTHSLDISAWSAP